MSKKIIGLFSYYHFIRTHCPLQNRTIYFDSHGSSDFAGNMFRIAEYLLQQQTCTFKIYISLNDTSTLPNNVVTLIKKYPCEKIKLVKRLSPQNFYALAISKYLFTDVSFPVPYEKRSGQIIIQTWHGTPLKKIGFDNVNDVAYTTNQKRAFAIADYCLFPNEYTMNHMIDSYRLTNTMQGKILLNGYPRNSIFFDKTAANSLRDKLELTDKQIFVYMPTWRGSLRFKNQRDSQTDLLYHYLSELDHSLSDRQIVFAKLHRLNSTSIDFTCFRHIRQFPEEYETYQFLAMADCLITDYSSVMFDFLCTRKKIILFIYDKQDYLQYQGTYINLSELPFPQVETVPQLIKEMNFSKQYDDSAAFQAFCPYDNINATAQLCDKIIDKQDSCIEIDPPHNYKKNTLLFCGALTPCNTTLNFMEFLDTLDITENNYIVTFLNRDFVKNPIRLQCITKEFNLISMDYFDKWIICPTITEYLALNIFKRVRFTRRLFRSKVRALFQKEFSRQFFGIDFEKIICYGGLNLDSLYLLTFSNVKEKYILTYPEMHKADKNFSTLLEEIKQSGGNIMPVTDNRLLHSEYLLTDFNLSNQS